MTLRSQTVSYTHLDVYKRQDDDGETAAGSRMLHLITIMDVWNVIVVVARWFGGAHIGPDRFKHINSTAREAVSYTHLDVYKRQHIYYPWVIWGEGGGAKDQKERSLMCLKTGFSGFNESVLPNK